MLREKGLGEGPLGLVGDDVLPVAVDRALRAAVAAARPGVPAGGLVAAAGRVFEARFPVRQWA
ncbi:MAG: hypothetical protein QN183_09885 [Armatimonadota bacterium]|nr:hypothetical protein [Armatimonadota bacterium]MDR7533808.1 hypothetical protein [Armatimonadota bacterium]MDR7536663.1 hypothetical protein [Armatimonadota bacterium]